jgi:hypothetical protein
MKLGTELQKEVRKIFVEFQSIPFIQTAWINQTILYIMVFIKKNSQKNPLNRVREVPNQMSW